MKTKNEHQSTQKSINTQEINSSKKLQTTISGELPYLLGSLSQTFIFRFFHFFLNYDKLHLTNHKKISRIYQ